MASAMLLMPITAPSSIAETACSRAPARAEGSFIEILVKDRGAAASKGSFQRLGPGKLGAGEFLTLQKVLQPTSPNS